MRPGLNRVVLAVLLSIFALATSGCTLQILSGFGLSFAAKIDPTSGEAFALVDEVKGDCFFEEEFGDFISAFISCFVHDLVSDFFGVSEYLMKFPNDVEAKQFRDPLIAQVPANVSNFGGAFTGTTSGSLAVQSGVSCVNTVPGEQLCAESGQQLVILDLPDGTPNGNYTISVFFTVTPPAPITVKAVATGKVVVGGQTFYPILMPCITSFAGAPSVTIPLSTTPVGIPLPTSSVTPCVGRTIDFTQLSAQAVPTLGQGAFLALAALLVVIAVYAIGRRRRTA
jgi:hypothetical protein